MLKEVAVVITCYNYAQYVGRAIRSCQEQTFPAKEIIIVNDGSTDGSDVIIRHFAAADPSIRCIDQQNLGQTMAKNAGIAASRSPFVAFLDADDWWEVDKLARQMPLLDDPQVGVVYSTARYVDVDGQPLDLVVDSETLVPRRGRVTDPLFIDNFVPFSSAVVRSTCFDRFGVFDESLSMGIDWDLWLRLSTDWSFDYVDAPLLVYRIGHPGQMSKNAEERMRCSDRIMRKFVERYPSAVSLAAQLRATAFTCVNRGDYYAGTDRYKALGYYLQSLCILPLQKMAYGALLRLALRR